MGSCEKCAYLGFDSCGGEPGFAVEWPICEINESYSNLKSFPFKKDMPCFEMSFWHSEFVDIYDGTDKSMDLAGKKFREKYWTEEQRKEWQKRMNEDTNKFGGKK